MRFLQKFNGKKFSLFVKFKQREGYCYGPKIHNTDENKLSELLCSQRGLNKKDELNEKIQNVYMSWV